MMKLSPQKFEQLAPNCADKYNISITYGAFRQAMKLVNLIKENIVHLFSCIKVRNSNEVSKFCQLVHYHKYNNFVF